MEQPFTFLQILLITVSAVVPTIAWLLFWIYKDNRPQPTRVLTLAFISGGLAVIALIVAAPWVTAYALSPAHSILVYAAFEEVAKFLFVAVLTFKSKTLVNPSDFIILLVTTGLGFAALENIFYFIGFFANSAPVVNVVASGVLRFVGATLLHATAGAVLGVWLGFSLRASFVKKICFAVIGIIFAIGIHTLFNYLTDKENPLLFFAAMGITWACIGVSFYFLGKFHAKNVNNATKYVLD